jgi:hypothetical protein
MSLKFANHDKDESPIYSTVKSIILVAAFCIKTKGLRAVKTTFMKRYYHESI